MFLPFPPEMLLPKGLKQHKLDSKTSQLGFSFSSPGAICLQVSMVLYVLCLYATAAYVSGMTSSQEEGYREYMLMEHRKHPLYFLYTSDN